MASQVLSSNTTFLRGFPVSKESAEKIYCGLEKNWWKQLYDGKFHHLGVEVFDKALHRLRAEPGFHDSAFKAFEFAKSHLTEKLSVDFYLGLHKVACAHFKGKENNTGMDSSEAGRFRPSGGGNVRCKIKLRMMLKEIFAVEKSIELINLYSILREDLGDKIVEICGEGIIVKIEDKVTRREDTCDGADVQEIENLIQKKFQALNETLNEWANDPIVKNAIPKVNLIGDELCLFYSEAWFNMLVTQLFVAFNRTLSEINEELINTPLTEREKIDSLVERKLVLIENLFQNLEWLHPFRDGQGRTDLLLLAKLLSENGFTPAILDEPYMSSFSSREDWLAYLKEGMHKWEEERKKTIAVV